MPKGSDLFVAALENEGVERIFAVPGEENLDFLDSLRASSIELVLCRHEQAAAFMAATHGRLTGQPGVCLTTLGPGALNLATGAAYAHLGAMPMIMITGQKAIHSPRQAGFQIVDVVAVFRPLTKLSRQIVCAESIPAIVRDAFRLAGEERPGPVLLELPEDVAGSTTSARVSLPACAPLLPVASDTALDRAAAAIMAAQRPLVMLGAGASRPRNSESITDFVTRVGIPYFTTQMGKGTVASGQDLYLGTAALTEHDYVHDVVAAADLIVTIGHDTIEKPPFVMNGDEPRVIHIGFSPPVVDPVYQPTDAVIGDIGPSLERLASRLEGRLPNAGALLPMRDAALASTDISESARTWPPTPQRIVGDVRAVMPADGIVALDNGMYKIWFARSYRTYHSNTLLLDNALATMGAGLPSAMAAALTFPGRRVMAVCGDGGFMMNSQEMETAVRLGLDLVVLILEDGAYGMIRWKQSVEGFDDYGLTFGNPDFVAYAASYGVPAVRVSEPDGLAPALEAAFAGGGVRLVVVPIDYSENERVLVDELRNRVRPQADASRTSALETA